MTIEQFKEKAESVAKTLNMRIEKDDNTLTFSNGYCNKVKLTIEGDERFCYFNCETDHYLDGCFVHDTIRSVTDHTDRVRDAFAMRVLEDIFACSR